MQPELGENGWTSRTTRVSDDHVLVKSDYDRDDEAAILLELLPDKPCLIVPSTLTSGVEGRFELRYVPKGSCCWCSGGYRGEGESYIRSSAMQNSQLICSRGCAYAGAQVCCIQWCLGQRLWRV